MDGVELATLSQRPGADFGVDVAERVQAFRRSFDLRNVWRIVGGVGDRSDCRLCSGGGAAGATTNGGKTLWISNDNDFGIDTIAVDPSGLWTVHQKVLPPTGEVDDGVILKVDMTKLPATVRTATVTLKVK